MSIFMMMIIVLIFAVGLFDFLYYLPQFKALEDEEFRYGASIANIK